MGGEDNTVDRIADSIVALADAALRQGSYYLLSQLGKDLGPDLNTLKLVTKQSLGAFVRDRLSDKFTIVKTGEFNNVRIPVKATMNSDAWRPVDPVDDDQGGA